jgi:hypothetical protein
MPRTNAERSKTKRTRRALGDRVVQFPVPEQEFRAAMIAGGYIARRDAADWNKLTDAIARLNIAIIGKLIGRDTRVTRSSPDQQLAIISNREQRGRDDPDENDEGRGNAAAAR